MSTSLSGSLPALRRVAPRIALLALALAGLGFGGCSQRPQDVTVASHGKEYFPESTYGRASRRVVADGQPVPRGGGQYLVGKPYTIAGRTYYPSESKRTQVGSASWYGDAFHGRLTANGEIYDRDAFTAASPTMPLPSYARVTNLRNNSSMIVRVNDRGPYASDRIMDVSRRVAEALDFKRYGTAKLKVEYVGRASLSGSDDARLYATLRTNGSGGSQSQPTMVAEAPRPSRVASIAPYAPPAREEYEPVRRAPRQVVEMEPRRRAPPAYEIEDRAPRRPTHFASRDPDDREWTPRHSARAQEREESRVPRSRLASYEPRHSREAHDAPLPPTHLARDSSRHIALPPSRPMDLGTIPGAASQIRAHRDAPRLRLARSRDD